MIVFTNPVVDTSGKVVGKNHAACATTVGARNFAKSDMTCNGSLVLRDGTLTWQGTFKVGAASSTGTITGGTGAYANARGVFVAKQDSERHARHDHPRGLREPMSVSAHRPAVDVAPRTARPGLALLLAVLAVPGSTWAWELPLGGLWIGLPLAVAAIVARRCARAAPASGRVMATAAIVIAGLCIAQMAVYTVASSVS